MKNKNSEKPRIIMIGPLPPPVHGSAMMTQYIKDSKTVNERCKLEKISNAQNNNKYILNWDYKGKLMSEIYSSIVDSSIEETKMKIIPLIDQIRPL